MTVLTGSDGDYFQNVSKLQKAHNREIRKVAYVKDPQSQVVSLVTCGHDSMKIWNISNEQDESVSLSEEREFNQWRNGTQDFDVTSDGKLAAVVSIDSVLHQITVPSYDQSSDTIESFDKGFMEVWFVRIAPDQSEYLTISFSGSLITMDMTGAVTKTSPFNGVRQVSALDYSPDGKSMAFANNEGIVTIVSSTNLTPRFNFEAHALKVRAICFSPDSKHVLTGSDDKTVKLYEISSNKAQHVNTFCGHRSNVTAVQFDRSFDGQKFASCSNDSSVIIWNAQSAQPYHIFQNLHEGVVTSISFSFDNQFLASVGEDRTICISRVDDGSRQISDKYDEYMNEGESHSQDYDSSLYGVEGIPRYSAGMYSNQYNPGSQEDEEEDELLVRARRDLEAVSDDEKTS